MTDILRQQSPSCYRTSHLNPNVLAHQHQHSTPFQFEEGIELHPIRNALPPTSQPLAVTSATIPLRFLPIPSHWLSLFLQSPPQFESCNMQSWVECNAWAVGRAMAGRMNHRPMGGEGAANEHGTDRSLRASMCSYCAVPGVLLLYGRGK
ncbi:hypothetical protein CC2G_006290 [Coprinopsis cinerea AmutBmut pab1-1]|nr:hypothetical protein CC2G_006290 [Coprinopsis cinerea AmutBmut pab1-1]